MRYLLSFLIAVLFGFITDARSDETRTLFKCVTTEVLNDSVFEESLSVEEYPEVSATTDPLLGYTLRIGSSIYRSSQGARISEENHGHNVTAVSLLDSMDERVNGIYKLTVWVTEPTEGEDHLNGTIVLEPKNELSSAPVRLIARLKCEL